jgi:hypothetical protein
VTAPSGVRSKKLFVGEGMKPLPQPNIVEVRAKK